MSTTAIMVLMIGMALGGPVLWWILIRTGRPLPPAAAGRARLGLYLLLGAGVLLLVAPIDSAANTVATVVWLLGGLLTVWATSSGRGGTTRA